MTLSKRRQLNQTRERGYTLVLGVFAFLFIIPMLGLVVDVGFLYGVKGQLQASVDGAALASARALTLGATTSAQATSAKQTAVNWFYANFPPNTWGTSGTSMDTTDTHVSVYDDTHNPNLRHVDVTASTVVPTYFMKWFGATTNTISAKGFATRRDVVAMMVLDRSGSMGSSCTNLKTAAKIFTGQFAAGRDQIGLISFSGSVVVQSSPVTTFQTTLGYSNGSGSGAGAIDNITCNGGTASSDAISIAYNELYKKALPGALNIIMFETDGLPDQSTFNWWDGTSMGIASGSSCKDKNSLTVAGGGWTTSATAPNWFGGMTMGPSGYMADVPSGAIGGFYYDGSAYWMLGNPIGSSVSSGSNDAQITSSAPGCTFSGGWSNSKSDFAWLPATDVYGNAINPTYPSANIVPSTASTAAFKSITTGTNGRTIFGTASDNTNSWAAMVNTAENAAYRARGSYKSCSGSTCVSTGSTLQAYIFAIGLGSNGGVDHTLLQRIANDANGDVYNSPTNYYACNDATHNPNCATFSNQLKGVYIYSPTASQLNQAFLNIASQVLRLSN